HRPVGVREVGCQPLALGRGKALNRILQGPWIVPPAPEGLAQPAASGFPVDCEPSPDSPPLSPPSPSPLRLAPEPWPGCCSAFWFETEPGGSWSPWVSSVSERRSSIAFELPAFSIRRTYHHDLARSDYTSGRAFSCP